MWYVYVYTMCIYCKLILRRFTRRERIRVISISSLFGSDTRQNYSRGIIFSPTIPHWIHRMRNVRDFFSRNSLGGRLNIVSRFPTKFNPYDQNPMHAIVTRINGRSVIKWPGSESFTDGTKTTERENRHSHSTV